MGKFALDVDDTPFSQEMKLCIGLYEKLFGLHRAEDIDIKKYIGMNVDDAMGQLLPGEIQKQIWNTD